MTNYPKDFFWFNEPKLYGYEPQKTIINYEKIDEYTVSNECYEDITLPEGANSVKVDIDVSFHKEEIGSIKVIFARKSMIPNPNYDKEIKIYEQKVKEHQEKLAEWKKWKEIYDKELAELKEQNDRKQYEELKKKFEKE